MFKTMAIEIPFPETLLAFVWAGIGLSFGRGFGKEFDQNFQATEWFKNLPPWSKIVVKMLLDTIHHWWMGGLLMVYSRGEAVYWFGWGLFVDDLPDVPPRIIKFLDNWQDYIGNGTGNGE